MLAQVKKRQKISKSNHGKGKRSHIKLLTSQSTAVLAMNGLDIESDDADNIREDAGKIMTTSSQSSS